MDEKALIGRILNLGEGWVVKDMIVNKSMKEVDIYIEYTKSNGFFPGTKTEFKIYDFKQSRRFRHLDIFEYKTYLNARLPRIKNDNSEIKIIELSWAGERLNYTYLFENRVIELLQMSKNQTKTADYFNTTYDIVHGIMERAVARGLKRRDLNGIRAISLDEKSIGNGQKYITVLSDPINKCVLDIIEGRKVEDTGELLTWTLSPKQLDNIWIVSMDMWKPYLLAVEEFIPQADIVHDKFHIAKYLNKAVDDVRKEEIKEQEVLKKTKYLFLKNKENWTEYQTIKFEEINQINLATSQAWQIKENFKGIYEQGNKQLCINYFEQWYKDVIEKNIKPMIKVADTMLNHIKGIVNAAVTDITNSIAENLNAQIQVVKSIARGYANANSYRNAILFFQGNLKMFHS
jgi:transposase